MRLSILQYLICPVCKSNLSVKGKTIQNEIKSGSLICKNRHKFYIEKGIPKMIVDKSSGFSVTEKAFSKKWSKYYTDFQSKKWYDFTEKWFLERFGWKNVSEFNKFLSSKKFILDAGTGIGNSAKRFSANPKSQVFAIDASDSIFFAQKKYGSIPNVHFIQADILQLPFKKNFFDFICSDQVLHHTKSTRLAFKKLVNHLKKKGVLSVYVYRKKGPLREFADDFIREKTTRMSEKDCLRFSEDMSMLGRELSKLKKTISIKRDIPILNIKAGKYDVQRFFYWNFIKCFWDQENDFKRSVGVNFDWYFPKFAWRHTPDEVKKWHKQFGLNIIHFQEIESGISTNGMKK
ncbi:methyltransferase domain-containing protein [Candidatus Nitrosotenuis uzonensis]|nr:methyltransferase domain-containing protein [Candidatus Nitrosotenuis uzonensis]